MPWCKATINEYHAASFNHIPCNLYASITKCWWKIEQKPLEADKLGLWTAYVQLLASYLRFVINKFNRHNDKFYPITYFLFVILTPLSLIEFSLWPNQLMLGCFNDYLGIRKSKEIHSYRKIRIWANNSNCE